MITIRKGTERGHNNYGWLDTRHTFSFSDYHDPRHMGFRTLRVLNDDRVAPGGGFPSHSHRDMEIVSYVLDGELEHRDSTGTGSVIRPGEIQRMSAGSGVVHSEYNHSQTDPVRFLQIWMVPAQQGLSPSYEQKAFPAQERRGRLRLVASPDGSDGSVTVHQDARVYSALLSAGDTVTHRLAPDRHAWVQIASGSVRAGDHELEEGDGLAVSQCDSVDLTGITDAEVVLFDLN